MSSYCSCREDASLARTRVMSLAIDYTMGCGANRAECQELIICS